MLGIKKVAHLNYKKYIKKHIISPYHLELSQAENTNVLVNSIYESDIFFYFSSRQLAYWFVKNVTG